MPSSSPSSEPSLRDLLRCNEVAVMVENARLTADAPDTTQRRQEAERQVHQAMYRAALGQITAEERHAILTILTPCCPALFFSIPTSDDLVGIQ